LYLGLPKLLVFGATLGKSLNMAVMALNGGGGGNVDVTTDKLGSGKI